MTLVARHGALTDIGLHRKTNEDTFVVQPPLYAICDGMGGANAGEVASGIAAETLAAEVARGTPLHAAAEAANAAVYQRAQGHRGESGMGTTLTALLLEGDAARFAHIGDSRIYLLRGDELRQISDDHSLVGEMVRDGHLTVEEAAVHPHRSILSRALGTEAQAQIDEFGLDLLPGDVLLLCSDGLSGPVSADEILAALTRDDPQEAAELLIQEARRRGGPDNITAVVVRLDEAPDAAAAPADEAEVTEIVRPASGGVEADTSELPFVVDAAAADEGVEADEVDAADALAALRTDEDGTPAAADPLSRGDHHRRSLRRHGIVAAVLAVLAIAAAAAVFFLSTVFFVGVHDGRLAIYSGVPERVGPVPLHAVYRRSVVTYDSLTPTARTLVDERKLRDREGALELSRMLGMSP